MFSSRVIPVLLLESGGLIKSVKFKNPQYIGDPINAVRIFNEKEVDEIVLLDTLASKEGREPDYLLIEDIASECFMPFAYGGGINSIKQAEKLIKLGAEKIILNHILQKTPHLVKEIATYFGSSTVVASIDVKTNFWGNYEVFSHTKRKITGQNPTEFAKQLEGLGVGEIFLNSVDLDGTMQGYDLKLIKSIVDSVSVPVVACGGAGSQTHLKDGIHQANASAVAAGSMFVFQGVHRAVLISYPSRKEILDII
ncbi:AglZ/HisF2 family acetamidino modification protein [Runella slithyformis]|uniref:imidazole glycerol-phosphate synthase n=1 Tax=Runella slithyformis (strain ATCC 29530 / DSM 19594 / LMG 11500 / NCIMB 11436 / LSU 4) TaxID=761193 RepID=A0A7U3ZNF6_RUNSL|nr:AglZ/HisF2 family acetamidino modification protein [Runella slithyformis]AEI50303.1 histidine biosynthesis protein [Runella slithyformis DSM 19594]